jgi:hypothetical protein
VGDESHLLLYVEVVVESRFPSNALLLGRVVINRMLDAESRSFNLPLVIARFDLIGEDSDGVGIENIASVQDEGRFRPT